MGSVVRLSPRGVRAEQGAAVLSARKVAVRDDFAEPGEPSLSADCVDGAAALDLLCGAAAIGLDGLDIDAVVVPGS